MARINRRTGYSLVIVGLAGLVFFWATDPRYGFQSLHDVNENIVDSANWGLPGTLIGLAGSLLVLGIGCYLLRRRPV